MKRFALMVVLLAGLASSASAQVGRLGIYADAAGNDCNILDQGAAGLRLVYVVHKFDVGEGATASRFLVQTTNVTMTPSGFVSNYAVLGQPNTGASVGYGQCINTTIVVMQLNYIGFGTNPACGLFEIKPDPIPGAIQITNCDFGDINVPDGGSARVNPDGTCQCNIATNQSTWGGVKALYK